MKLDSYFTTNIKINSKCIKELNARPKAIKLLEEENTGKTLMTLDFLGMSKQKKKK